MFDEGAYDTAEGAGAFGPLQDNMFAVHLIGLVSGGQSGHLFCGRVRAEGQQRKI